jgi:hypothetical protein
MDACSGRVTVSEEAEQVSGRTNALLTGHDLRSCGVPVLLCRLTPAEAEDMAPEGPPRVNLPRICAICSSAMKGLAYAGPYASAYEGSESICGPK